MASEGVAVGQVFTSDDGGIRVTVIRVGSSEERARFQD
jgi:hypothetical protein